MGKRMKEGMKGGAQGRKASKRKRTGAGCPLGLVPYQRRDQAEADSSRGKAKRCGRCRQWHPA